MKLRIAILITVLFSLLIIISCSETTTPSNNDPKIQSITATPSSISVNDTTSLTCVATDADGDNLTITWSANIGTFPNGNIGLSVQWQAPPIGGSYEITATVNDGKSTDEGLINVNVQEPPPPPPPVLSSPANGTTDVILLPTLIWNASSGATNYTLQVSESSNFTSFVYNLSGLTGQSQLVSGLNNLITYYWRVSATNSYGTSIWSTVWSFTTTGTAPAPSVLSSPANGATNVNLPSTLVWDASSGAESYTLQVSENNNFTSFVYNQSALTGTSQQINGLNNLTPYYWRVSATNSYGTSDWSEIWSFTTGIEPCPGIPIVVYEGKTYNTVKIGSQCWLRENLDVGVMIDSLQNAEDNGVVEKYCYDNDPANCETYGGLYQWDETMQYSTAEGTQGICPSGWHIPTKEEFEILAAAVNWDANKLKAIGQGTGTGAGTNTSGFSALLTGGRYGADFYFLYLGRNTYIWSSTESDANDAISLGLFIHGSGYVLGNNNRGFGDCVRCIKD